MRTFLNRALRAAALVMTLGVVACADVERSDDQGALSVRLDVDAEVYTRSAGQIEAPEAESFALTVSATDGDYTNTWQNLTLFGSDVKLEAGDYVLTATSGDMSVEGFGAAAFKAETKCKVVADKNTLVNMVATLANSCVTVSQSDAFLKYFSEWSVELVSGNGTRIPFVEGEERLAYVAPKPFDVEIAYTTTDGVKGSATIDVDKVEARTRYNVRLDVNGGEIGVAKIVISFDDSVDSEKVEIEIDEQ